MLSIINSTCQIYNPKKAEKLAVNNRIIPNNEHLKDTYNDSVQINGKKQNLFLKNMAAFTGAAIKNVINPIVAVVGSFDQKIIDVDGDEIPDLSHDDVVSRIAKAVYPEIETIPFEIETDKNGQGAFDLNQPLLKLNEILELLKKGQKFDAVNLSLGKEIEINTLREITGLPIDNQNLNEYKDQVRNWLKKPVMPLQIKTILDCQKPGKSDQLISELTTLNKIVEAIEKITEQGVPVYIGAGNQGSDYFNILSIAKGSVPVGAEDAIGNKESFSSNNSLIKRFEQGTYNVSKVTDRNNTLTGYDITGSGKAEVKASETSGNEPVVNAYIGKELKNVIAQEDDYASLIEILNRVKLIKNIKSIPGYMLSPDQAELAKKVKKVTNHDIGTYFDEITMQKKSQKVLFPIKGISNIHYISPEKLKDLQAKGNFVNASLDLVFKTDKDGKIVFDPDNSARPAVNELFGTSFASPKALAKDLKMKYLKAIPDVSAKNYTVIK